MSEPFPGCYLNMFCKPINSFKPQEGTSKDPFKDNSFKESWKELIGLKMNPKWPTITLDSWSNVCNPGWSRTQKAKVPLIFHMILGKIQNHLSFYIF